MGRVDSFDRDIVGRIIVDSDIPIAIEYLYLTGACIQKVSGQFDPSTTDTNLLDNNLPVHAIPVAIEIGATDVQLGKPRSRPISEILDLLGDGCSEGQTVRRLTATDKPIEVDVLRTDRDTIGLQIHCAALCSDQVDRCCGVVCRDSIT